MQWLKELGLPEELSEEYDFAKGDTLLSDFHEFVAKYPKLVRAGALKMLALDTLAWKDSGCAKLRENYHVRRAAFEDGLGMTLEEAVVGRIQAQM